VDLRCRIRDQQGHLDISVSTGELGGLFSGSSHSGLNVSVVNTQSTAVLAIGLKASGPGGDTLPSLWNFEREYHPPHLSS
jgi:hypothetical protein